jgi:hypothetical protein
MIVNVDGSLIRKKHDVEFVPWGKDQTSVEPENEEMRELGKFIYKNSKLFIKYNLYKFYR